MFILMIRRIQCSKSRKIIGIPTRFSIQQISQFPLCLSSSCNGRRIRLFRINYGFSCCACFLLCSLASANGVEYLVFGFVLWGIRWRSSPLYHLDVDLLPAHGFEDYRYIPLFFGTGASDCLEGENWVKGKWRSGEGLMGGLFGDRQRNIGDRLVGERGAVEAVERSTFDGSRGNFGLSDDLQFLWEFSGHGSWIWWDRLQAYNHCVQPFYLEIKLRS